MPIIRTTFDALAGEVEHLESHGREVTSVVPVDDTVVLIHVKPLPNRSAGGLETR